MLLSPTLPRACPSKSSSSFYAAPEYSIQESKNVFLRSIKKLKETTSEFFKSAIGIFFFKKIQDFIIKDIQWNSFIFYSPRELVFDENELWEEKEPFRSLCFTLYYSSRQSMYLCGMMTINQQTNQIYRPRVLWDFMETVLTERDLSRIAAWSILGVQFREKVI